MGEKELLLRDYLNYKRVSIKSKGKLKDVENYISGFLNVSQKSPKEFSEKELISYLNKISNKYSTETLNGIKAYTKNFIKWYFVDWSSRFRSLDNLCRTHKSLSPYKPEQMLTKEDIEKLVQIETEPFWKAFWLVLFYGGFRPSEVAKLKWKDIDFEKEGAFVSLIATKTNNRFEKFLPENVCFYLKKLRDNKSEYVFPRPDLKKPVSKTSIYYRLTMTSKKAFGKPINPYLLRHSIATILYNDDKLKADDVAQQMGHTKDMKFKYSHLSKEKIRERSKGLFINPELTPEENNKIKLLQEQLIESHKGFAEIFRLTMEMIKKPNQQTLDKINKKVLEMESYHY